MARKRHRVRREDTLKRGPAITATAPDASPIPETSATVVPTAPVCASPQAAPMRAAGARASWMQRAGAFWKDPVWSKVIAAAITALLGGVFLWLGGVFLWPWRSESPNESQEASRTVRYTEPHDVKPKSPLPQAPPNLAKRANSQAASNRSPRAVGEINSLLAESIRGQVAIKNIRLKEPLTVGERPVVLVETENLGKSVAYVRQAHGTGYWDRLPPGEPPITMPAKDSADAIPPGTSSLAMIAPPDPLTQAALDGIGDPPTGYKTIFFFGRIDYETLGQEHSVEFCAYLMPFDTRSIPETAATRGTKTDARYMLRQCDRWHSIR